MDRRTFLRNLALATLAVTVKVPLLEKVLPVESATMWAHPHGTLLAWVGKPIPSGWLPCDGASLSRDQYPKLFEALGYQYGGEGTTFNLPDLKTRFPVFEKMHEDPVPYVVVHDWIIAV